MLALLQRGPHVVPLALSPARLVLLVAPAVAALLVLLVAPAAVDLLVLLVAPAVAALGTLLLVLLAVPLVQPVLCGERSLRTPPGSTLCTSNGFR